MTDGEKYQLYQDGYCVIPSAVSETLVENALRQINKSIGDPGDGLRDQTFRKGLGSKAEIKDLLHASPVLMGKLGSSLGRFFGGQAGQVALRYPGDMCGDDFRVGPNWQNHWHIDGLANPHTPSIPANEVHNFTALVGVVLADVMSDYSGNLTVYPGSHFALGNYFSTNGLATIFALGTQGLPKSYFPEDQKDESLMKIDKGFGFQSSSSWFGKGNFRNTFKRNLQYEKQKQKHNNNSSWLHNTQDYESGITAQGQGQGKVEFKRPAQILAKAGDAIIVNYLNAHTIAPNTSPYIRYCVYFRLHGVKTAKFKKENGWNSTYIPSMMNPWDDWSGMQEICRNEEEMRRQLQESTSSHNLNPKKESEERKVELGMGDSEYSIYRDLTEEEQLILLEQQVKDGESYNSGGKQHRYKPSSSSGSPEKIIPKSHQDKSVDKEYEEKDLKVKKGVKGRLPTVEDYYAGTTSTSSSTESKNLTYLSEDFYRYLSTLSEEEQCRQLMKATSFGDEK